MVMQDFFSVVVDDARITASHISLYFALLSGWESQHCPQWLAVDRSKLMNMSKINGRSTYDKCMHDLHAFRYVNYRPVRAKGGSRLAFKRLV